MSKERTTITVIAAACIVGALALFNIAGWVITWANSLAFAVLFSAIALASEILGFNLAISIERQWRDKRRSAALACAYALAICMVVNLVSGHNAWLTFERAMFAPQVAAEQAEIDTARARLQLELASIDSQIAAARPPIAMQAGPQGRAEARRVYELEVQRLAPQRAAAQARLDAEPVAAPERHVAPDWAVWALFASIEIMKAVLLWAIGAGLARTTAVVEPQTDDLPVTSEPKDTESTVDPNVAAQVSYLMSVHPKQSQAWRLRHAERRSIAAIARRMKLSEKQIMRLLREGSDRLKKYYDAETNVTPIDEAKNKAA